MSMLPMTGNFFSFYHSVFIFELRMKTTYLHLMIVFIRFINFIDIS